MADEKLDPKSADAATEQEAIVSEVVVDEAPAPDPKHALDQDVIKESDDVAGDVDNDTDIPMNKLEAVLNSTANKSDMTPQMRRMMQRQQDNTRRVEDTKANPGWFVPLFCTLMIIGLIWAVVFYLTYTYPIPGIGQWNLAIAFAFILVGFIMTMWWR